VLARSGKTRGQSVPGFAFPLDSCHKVCYAIGMSKECVICQSSLRGTIDAHLWEKKNVGKNGNKANGMSLADICEKAELLRAEKFPDEPPIVLTALSHHFKQHELRPVIFQPVGSVITQSITKNTSLEHNLDEIIDRGMALIGEGVVRVSPTILVRAMSLRLEIEKAKRSRSPYEEALEKKLRDEGIPSHQPLGGEFPEFSEKDYAEEEEVNLE